MTASDDGQKLLTTSEDGSVICWNLPKLTPATVIKHPYCVSLKKRKKILKILFNF